MDDVRGRLLGLPHGTTPAAVTTNKNIKMSSFKSSENIQKKEGGPDRSVSDNQSSSVITSYKITSHDSYLLNFFYKFELGNKTAISNLSVQQSHYHLLLKCCRRKFLT